MFRKSIQNAAVSIIVLFCVAINTIPAYAGWEQGINVITTADAELSENQNFDTPEAFTAEVIRLVNVERANENLSALSRLETLVKPAGVRAQESAAVFAHIRPNGSSCSTVYSDFSLIYKSAGENLAYGYSAPADVVKAWMNSKSHRANIMSKKFSYAEAGFYENTDGVIYCSLLLYTPEEN
ncbi:MAG: CAP domain-containing protein [Oscillospiraceae bacterium]|nr:CAP domain-containing protein [Oscillospiraceae bacterium]